MNLPPTFVDDYTFGLIYEVLDKIPEDATIVELGSFVGGSIIRITNKLKELNKLDNVNIHVVDNWICENISYEGRQWSQVHDNFLEKFLDNVKIAGIFDKLTINCSDSLVPVDSHQDNTIDLLFVDDGHTYPHTKNVLEAWLPKVKIGGYIIGHDFSSNGVEMAVKEILGINVGFCETRSAYIYQKC